MQPVICPPDLFSVQATAWVWALWFEGLLFLVAAKKYVDDRYSS